MVENEGKYVCIFLIAHVNCMYVILRKIYGPTYENVYLRIKINQEIYNKFKYPDTLNVMKECRFEWLGHVTMDDERTVKQLLEGKSGGRGEGDYS